MSNLTHAFTVKRDSKPVQFYLWLYDADPKRINTCKLFWAFLLSPIALVFRAILTLVLAVYSLVPRRSKHEVVAVGPDDLGGGVSVSVNLKVKGPSRFERILEWISEFLSSATAKRVGRVIFYGAIGLWVLYMAGIVLYALIVETVTFLTILGGIVLVVLVIAILAALYNYFDGRRRVGRAVDGVFDFANLLRRLGHSFHDRTCARVVVED